MESRYVSLQSNRELHPDVVRRLFPNPPETFSPTGFCKRCKSFKLDFRGEELSDDSEDSSAEPLSLQGIRVPQSLSSDCGLCIMMGFIDHTTTSYALKLTFDATPFTNAQPKLWDIYTVSSVFPRRSLFSLRGAHLDYSPQRHLASWNSFFTWRISPLEVDYSSLQNSFLHCLKYHRDTCGSVDRILVPGLEVIDCDSRKIVNATSRTRYAALSYVWGPFQQSTISSISRVRKERILPEKVELTIEDAIAVTKQMGIRYLWIDRFCIDENGSHKHAQIQQMHSIYQSAEVTIIAGAGNDPNYGLPGVSSTPRKRSPACLFDNYLLFNSMKSQEDVLAESKWNSRAWTYQESRFSRRRVVFTDQEVSFSCCLMSTTECSQVDETRQKVPSTRLTRTWKTTTTTTSTCRTTHATGVFPSDIGRRIVEYSGRELTYESDAIRAFSGILQAFIALQHPVYHIWAVPVLPPYQEIVYPSRTRQITRIKRTSSDGFLMGLRWSLHHPATRRLDFPSWSWVGWHGGVSSSTVHHYESRDASQMVDTGISVSFEDISGHPLAWTDVEKNLYFSDSPDVLSHFLRLDAWAMTVSLRYSRGRDRLTRRGYVNVDASCTDLDGQEWMFTVYLTDKTFEARPPEADQRAFYAILISSAEWMCGANVQNRPEAAVEGISKTIQDLVLDGPVDNGPERQIQKRQTRSPFAKDMTRAIGTRKDAFLLLVCEEHGEARRIGHFEIQYRVGERASGGRTFEPTEATLRKLGFNKRKFKIA